VDSRAWLDDFEARLADLQKKSEDLQDNIAAASATVSSKDDSVTVTVGPNGGLQNLELGHRACDLGPARLTALILETARAAQRKASEKVVEAFEPLGGGTEAMRFVMDSIPSDDEDDEDERDYAEPEPEPTPQARAPQRAPLPTPQRPVRRSRPDDEDDENQPW
jgi:DNA-binding protein YbaB